MTNSSNPSLQSPPIDPTNTNIIPSSDDEKKIDDIIETSKLPLPMMENVARVHERQF